MTKQALSAVRSIRERVHDFTPCVGLILGSGLGELAASLEDAVSFAFAELPGFPSATVVGHAGRLWLGRIGATPVACLQGRIHLYEGHGVSEVKTLVRTLKLLGCDTIVVTNAAGSLNMTAKPGSLMLINDHINMLGQNPLVGPNDDDFGDRFPAMNDAYDPSLRARLKSHAEALNITLHEGVYLATLGPSFETPAEIRMMQRLGADAVGMSTVPEVIVARHCGMRVAGLSALTNYGAGMVDESLSHEQTLQFAGLVKSDFIALIHAFVSNWQNQP